MSEVLDVTVVNEGGEKLAVATERKKYGVNPALAYLASLNSETSVKTTRSKLNMFAQWAGYADLRSCEWSLIRPEIVVVFMAYLTSSGHKPSTKNAYLAAIKGTVKMGWISKVIDHDTYLRIAAIKGQKAYRLPSGCSLSREESAALLAVCNTNDIHGCRDKLMLAMMLGCGLRRAEVCTLRFENYDPNNQSFKLIGKGNKERLVFLPKVVNDLLEKWVEDFRGDMPGLLFGRIFKNNRLSLSKAMDPTTVGRIVRSRMLEANQSEATAHDLRRSFATRLLEKNVDLVTVKNMMGHANIATTAMYDRRGDEAMRVVAEDVDL